MATPEYLFTLIKGPEGYTAIGSRKVTQLDFTANIDYFETTFACDAFRSYIPPPTCNGYKIEGELKKLWVVQGATRLAALGALIDALDEEQRHEETQERESVARQSDYLRFGGLVDEELVKKIVKLRKKQAAKKEKEYDPDDEWDF